MVIVFFIGLGMVWVKELVLLLFFELEGEFFLCSVVMFVGKGGLFGKVLDLSWCVIVIMFLLVILVIILGYFLWLNV